jgi:hypothetical protein
MKMFIGRKTAAAAERDVVASTEGKQRVTSRAVSEGATHGRSLKKGFVNGLCISFLQEPGDIRASGTR